MGSEQALGRNLPIPIKDAFEVFVKILIGDQSQLVEDALDLLPLISVRIVSILAGHQETIGPFTQVKQVWDIVMEVARHKADLGGNFAQQVWCGVTVGDIGRGEDGDDGKPHSCDHAEKVQIPAIHPDKNASPIWRSRVSVSMEVGGTSPCSRCFWCQTPPRERSTVLSRATTHLLVAQGWTKSIR